MVINKDNVDDIENFVELALKMKAGFVVFFFDYTENNMDSEYFSNPEFIHQEVEATPIDELKRKYEKILKLAEGRNVIDEFNQRNKIRRECGKNELVMIDDL